MEKQGGMLPRRMGPLCHVVHFANIVFTLLILYVYGPRTTLLLRVFLHTDTLACIPTPITPSPPPHTLANTHTLKPTLPYPHTH